MEVLAHERLAALIHCGFDLAAELEAWARTLDAPPHVAIELHDIFSSARHERCKRFLRFARSHLGFDIWSARGADVLSEILPEACALAAARKTQPDTFVNSIRHVETNYWGGDVYPDGIWDLWNLFDQPCEWNEMGVDAWSSMMREQAELQSERLAKAKAK